MAQQTVQYEASGLYKELGVKRIINARVSMTMLGGSILPEVVMKAMEVANQHFVEMAELEQKAGAYIASVLGVEDAYVSSGCAAGLTLSTAACMAGSDPEKMGRLPDTTGMRNEVIFQKAQRFAYDRSLTLAGAKLVEVGDDEGCTSEQLEAAINANTVAVAYYVRQDWKPSVLPLQEISLIAGRKGIPVIADAAGQVYPLDYFRSIAQAADLVCFGAKYIGAPQSTGIACGKKQLVASVRAQGFIGFEVAWHVPDERAWRGHLPIGRPMKVDRQEIVGVVAALKRWFSMNHEDRFLAYKRKFDAIQQGLRGARNVKETRLVPNPFPAWPSRLDVRIDTRTLGKNCDQVARELIEGYPSIDVATEGQDTIVLNVHNLNEGEETIVIEKLRTVLAK